MSRKMQTTDWNSEVLRVTRHAFLAIGMIAACGAAMAQNGISDAQVEANVLKALASSPELANESITTKTVYGTVTLSGSVSSEAARTKAENLAANANGVQKVIDELTLGSAASASNQPAGPGNGQVLLSDGTYGPDPNAQAQAQATAALPPGSPQPGTAPAETAQRNNPDADQALDQQMNQQAPQQAGTQPNAQQPYPQQPGTQPNAQQQYPQQPPNGTQPPATANGQPAYPPNPYARRPIYAPPGAYPAYPYGYPQQAPPANGTYAQQPYYPQPGQQGYAQPQQPYYQQPPMGGQQAGQAVTVPTGSLLRVRINRTLRSDKTTPGTTFDGIVVNDVVANGLVAIPRGAAVQGTVVDAKSSGALTGRGEMSIQLTSVTLGGKNYPLTSDVWAHNGGDKTLETVNKTAGFGALGAIVGAVAGGGTGAAIGGGVGAAAGLGSSAASGKGQVVVPAESILTFHTAADAQVATVSEQEMQRLAYGVPAAGDQRPVPRTYRVYPGYYPPPVYYPYAGYPNY